VESCNGLGTPERPKFDNAFLAPDRYAMLVSANEQESWSCSEI
jgi:hypothetical protein